MKRINKPKSMEQAALRHAAEEIAYRRSHQAKVDAEADQAARANADRKAGHIPACTLTRCAPGCTHTSNKPAA